jgi:hypothetical protein
LLLDHAVVVDENQSHAVLEKLRLLEPWSAPAAAVRVQAPPAARCRPKSLSAARRYVVLHVPTLVRYKLWPIEHHVSWFGRCSATAGSRAERRPSSADRAADHEVLRGVGAPDDGRLLDVAGPARP